MTSHRSVGIDNDLPPGKARVGLRPADHKPARGINVVDDLLLVQEFTGNDRKDYLFNNILPQLLEGNIGAVLGSHHDGSDPARLSVHVFHCHLGFSIGAEIVQDILLAHLG